MVPAGCSGPASFPQEALPYRYVLLAQSPQGETTAFARVILQPGHACPHIDGSRTIAMTPRDNPHQFPVTVCEAQIGFGEDLYLRTDGERLALPQARKDIQRITLMGDTGCESSDCARGEPAQPFAVLAAQAAKTPADLLIHVGDYNYRGTAAKVSLKDAQSGKVTTQWAYDAGDGSRQSENCTQAPHSGFVSQNSAQSTQPDAWEFWRDDFFEPAGELLWAAPWVFARGNHELCSRAGPGWFYFLDASSNLPAGGGRQLSCPAPDPSANPFENVVPAPPYRVDLDQFHLWVVDSANACDAFVTPETIAFNTAYAGQLAQIGAATPAEGTTWLVTHRPLWGVEEYEAETSTGCTSENQYSCINQTLQKAVGQALGGKLPQGIGLLLAGHMHRFQSLTFASSDRPPQIIVGDSGVKLDRRPPIGTFNTAVEGMQASVRSTGADVTAPSGPIEAFGFMEIRLLQGGWEAVLTDLKGEVRIASCGNAQQAQGSVCEFEPGIEVR